MRLFILWILGLFYLSTLTESIEWYEEGNPIFLTQSTLDSALNDTNTIKVIKFFAPFCRYCRYLKQFVDQYQTHNMVHPNLKFYEVNCQQANWMCSRHFGVRSYPVIMVFDENAKMITQMDGLYPKNVIFNMLADYNVKAKNLSERLEREKSQQSKKDEKIEKMPEQKLPQIPIVDETPKQEQNMEKQQEREQKQQPVQEVKADPNEKTTQKVQNKEVVENIQKIQQNTIKEEQQILINQQNNQEKIPSHQNEAGNAKYILYGLGGVVVIAYGWHIHKTGVKDEKNQTSQHEHMEDRIINEESKPLSQSK